MSAPHSWALRFKLRFKGTVFNGTAYDRRALSLAGGGGERQSTARSNRHTRQRYRASLARTDLDGLGFRRLRARARPELSRLAVRRRAAGERCRALSHASRD